MLTSYMYAERSYGAGLPDGSVGMTFVRMKVAGEFGGNGKPVEFLVDSGSTYSIVPRGLLRALGVKPVRRERFEFAGGRRIWRQVGIAYLSFRGRITATHVIFGGARDEPLLGVHALEGLGYEVDPVNRRLRRARLFLMISHAS